MRLASVALLRYKTHMGKRAGWHEVGDLLECDHCRATRVSAPESLESISFMLQHEEGCRSNWQVDAELAQAKAAAKARLAQSVDLERLRLNRELDVMRERKRVQLRDCYESGPGIAPLTLVNPFEPEPLAWLDEDLLCEDA